MKNHLFTLLGVCFLGTYSYAQQPFPSNNYQPYSPTIVGGLPPNSSGLEQPVFVADRFSDPLEHPIANNSGTPGDPNSPVPTLEQMKKFDAGDRIAVVGTEPVLVGDLVPINKITPQMVANGQFEQLLRQALVEVVNRKALAQRFINDKVSGKSVKERETARKTITNQTTKIFFEKVVPMQMEKLKCSSAQEFDAKLAEMGKSIQSLQTEFAESTWAQEHLRESVKEKPQVELSEMNDYYSDNLETFRQPAKVRFQIMSALFSKHPDKQAAYQAIADMGNEVRFGGAPFPAVAKRSSSGLNAQQGGLVDWTSKSALKSKVIDKAIFENPVTGLSPIIEDADGYHIVEVLERKEEAIQTFAEVQSEIKKKIAKDKYAKMRSEFIRKVRRETPIWTKWPDDIPNSQNIDELVR